MNNQLRQSATKIFSGIILSLIFLFLSFSSRAQLTVSNAAPYNSVTYLVKNILLGNGVAVSGITYKGTDTAVGFFNGTKSSIGLDSGVLMTSGTITDAPGPNNTAGKTYSNPNCSSLTDSDLALLSGSPMDDACIIEFDFIPYSDTVKFQYVFASEEYPEYVGSFNDAFGFFISGPGISGPYSRSAENIALIPFSTTPVTINNVNCATNSTYYVCNWPSTTCLDPCPTSSSMPSTTVQYDGYTVPLTAVAAVECGKQYHIKLAIADAVDCAFDSGVFLKSGSFSTNGTSVSSAISYMNTTNPADTILYRGSCGKASIYFNRGTTTTTDTVIIDTVGSTAFSGIDYTKFNDTLIMPIGVGSDTLNINGIPSLNNDTVTLVLTVIQKICNTIDTQKVKVYISNPPKLVATEPATITCFNGGATLTPVVTGGVGAYTYNWSNGSTSSSISVSNITSDTTFLVHVKDICGDSTLDTVHINLVTTTPLKLTGKDTTVNCPVGTVPIGMSASGGKPAYSYKWNTGATTSSINVSPSGTTTYILTVTDSCGTKATDSVKVTVNDIPLVLSSHDTSIYCSGTVNLSVSATGGGGGYTYNWSNGSTTSSISVTASKDTSYVVTVSTPCGSQVKNDTVKVTVLPSPYPITIKAVPSSMCVGQSAVLTATGGGTYSWSTGETTSSITVTPGSTKTYTLQVTNGNCVNDTSITVTIVPPPTITLSPDQKICQGSSTTFTATITGATSYTWSNGATTSSITVSPSASTSYTLVATDGCVDSAVCNLTVIIPGLNACCDTTILPGASASIGATGASHYLWAPASSLDCDTCQFPTATPSVTTTYTVTGTDANGCSTERTVTVYVECVDFTVPNIFTPNDDGINDDFVIRALHPSSYSIIIYDRWGKEVYTSNDPTVYWNGRLLNTQYLVPDGVYYYIIKATCGGNNYDKKGFVEVLAGK